MAYAAVDTAPDGGYPAIIQGGMGVGVSGWRLARAVARTGQLGVVSGVALDALLARRLQTGDGGGHVRRALARFPVPALAEAVLRRYYVAGGLAGDRPMRPVPKLSLRLRPHGQHLAVAGAFVEVFLAKQGHDGPVGMNLLEKIQRATPAAVYGAMLAGVDYVLMGAGLPTEIPRLLDTLSGHRPARLPIAVHGALPGEDHHVTFDPLEVLGETPGALRRPRLLAIVSSATLAGYLARDAVTRPDGFVLEAPVAGGHSARPRGRLALDDDGEPVYGARDHIEVPKVAALGLPFWLAGGQSTPERLAAARATGAAGIQVGTAFALCRESGIDDGLRRRLLSEAADGTLVVRNDVRASRPDSRSRSRGSRCLCNGLIATVGLGQRRADGYREPPLVTLGQDLTFLPALTRDGDDYTAADVVGYLLAQPLISGPLDPSPGHGAP